MRFRHVFEIGLLSGSITKNPNLFHSQHIQKKADDWKVKMEVLAGTNHTLRAYDVIL